VGGWGLGVGGRVQQSSRVGLLIHLFVNTQLQSNGPAQ